MKTMTTLAALLAITLAAAGCGETQDDAQAWNEKAAETAAADPHAGHDHAPGEHGKPAAMPGVPGGEILETFDSGGYTYVRLKTADGEIWAAGPVAEVAIGDVITLSGAMAMKNFTASSLNRTFDEIWFASGFGGADAAPAADPHAAMKGTTGGAASEAASVDFSDLTPATDGVTIAQIFADRDDLAGQRVKVRGRVVKFLSGIMGRNWLHLQDGTGDIAAGDHDLTVTTDQTARQGDTVIIEGVLAVDRDFGSGYFYNVIVEESVITVEEAM